MTDLPLDVSDGQILYAADYNKILGTRTGDLKPIDDTTRNYTDGGGDVGTASVTWENVQTNTLTVEEGSTFTGLIDVNGGLTKRIKSFTSTETWSVPAGTSQIEIQGIAAGGGGGGGSQNGVDTGGAGGGGGASITGWRPIIGTANIEVAVTIGTYGIQGLGGDPTSFDGGDADDTIIEIYSSSNLFDRVVLKGGKGGDKGLNNNSPVGGLGGTGYNSGEQGENGSTTSGGTAGSGASSILGLGGEGSNSSSNIGGTRYGSGGAGGGATAPNGNGGNGGDAIVLVYY